MTAAFLTSVLWGSPAASLNVCEPSRSVHYEGSWQSEDFSVLDPSVVIDDKSGHLVLHAGGHDESVTRFVTAMPQEVRVTFIFRGSEASGHHLGYFLRSSAEKKGYVKSDGTLDRSAFVKAIDFTDTASYDKETFHYLWTCLRDDNHNGILDKPYGAGCLRSFSEASASGVDFAETEEILGAIDDGTGLPFVPDGDGRLTVRDMTKSLGIIGEGQEIIFFLVPQGRFQDTYLTEASWNSDVYRGKEPCTTTFASGATPKKYQVGLTAHDNGTCAAVSPWLPQQALARLRQSFGLEFDPDHEIALSLQTGKKFPHALVTSTPDVPGVRILAWEEDVEGGDTDHNDLVFAVAIKAVGRVVSKDISSTDPLQEKPVITAVDLEVRDRRAPCEGLDTGFFLDSGSFSNGNVSYSVSLDNGTTWIPVDRWEEVQDHEDGSQTRKAHLDLISLGRAGRTLRWKALLETVNTRCLSPAIMDVRLDFTASDQGTFSRSDPVVLGNALYSAGLELPSKSTLPEASFRGHLFSYLIYDPSNPATPLFQPLWDAGQALAERSLQADPRTIGTAVAEACSVRENVAIGDGTTRRFQGTLQHKDVLSGTMLFRSLSSSGIPMVLRDNGIGVLTGDGSGRLHRSEGAYTLEFLFPPCKGCPVTAEYAYAISTSSFRSFSETTITDVMLGLSDAVIHGEGFHWDLNRDARYDSEDRRHLIRWVLGFDKGTHERPWPLNGIDHSTPAVVGPPGLPPWYFGTQTSEEEREAYDHFRQSETMAHRPTIAYAGSLGGMIHAFHAGSYQHGDDPRTTVKENRGYFLPGEYGDGSELWAYIPSSHLSRLKSLLKPEPWLYPPVVNASPCVQDIAVRTETGGTFRTVLVSAQGTGGDTVLALDVTDPQKPSFLWHYSDPALYRSGAAPAMAKIGRLQDAGSPVWVVFVSSGQTDLSESPSLFLFDAASGKLLRKIFLDLGASNRGAVLSGSAAAVDTDGNGYVDRLYVADSKGHVVRLDFPDRADMAWDPAKIRVSLFVKVSSSIYATPAVYIAHTYKPDGGIDQAHVKIMFGIGDDPARRDNPRVPTAYKFYVFDDSCRMDWTAGVLRDNNGQICSSQGMKSEAEAEWVWNLPAGHRIWAEAVAAAGMVYFGTAVTETTDPCSPPQDDESKGGKVYAVDLSALDFQKEPRLMAETGGNVTALFVEDQHLYARVHLRDAGSRVQVVGEGVFNNETLLGTSYVTKAVKGSWRRILEK
ncbi:MAG: hypothetical protein WHS46_01870 [Desulfosoma sp.]